MEAQQAALRQQLQAVTNPAPVVRLHPDAATLYVAKVADLQAALNQPDARLEAMEALQTLIERIVLTPDESRPAGWRSNCTAIWRWFLPGDDAIRQNRWSPDKPPAHGWL